MSYAPGYFKGKKITIMGLGLLGRGLGDARFFAEEGADLIVTDLKSEDDLKTSVEELKDFSNIKFVLGEHRHEDFKDRDFILKAPNVPADSPYIAEARKNGIAIEQSAAIFASLTPAAIVGVTGTRGKSTTTELVHHILKLAGKSAFLGGNVRGVSTLPFVRTAKAGDIAVLELDSWQLQGFGERKISPRVAVFTNFMADHQNYYKGDMDAYFNDKAQIFRHQKPGDTLVVGSDLYRSASDKFKTEGKLVLADPADVPSDWKPLLPGRHNLSNIACAIHACRALGIGEEAIRQGIESFAGVEGRLEFLREKGGVRIYNDTNSTTPDATLVGLEALSKGKNVILIMGGADKQLSMSKLVQSLDFYCKHVVLLPGTGTDKLPEFGFDSVTVPVTRTATLEEAARTAFSKAGSGDIVLLSPAFASFGLFKNEYDRGDQFRAIASEI